MSLTTDIQSMLQSLKLKPDSPFILPRRIPPHIERELIDYAIEAIHANLDQFVPDEGGNFPDEFEILSDPSIIPMHLESYFSNLRNFGVKNEDDLRAILLCYLVEDILSLSQPRINLTKKQLDIKNYLDLLSYAWDELDLLDENYLNVDEIIYQALKNHLCYYSDERWQLTNLGKTILHMPEIQATRFLLALEIALNTGDKDYIHMSRGFLERIRESETDLSKDDNYPEYSCWNSYVKRLQKYGLAETDPDKSIRKLNPLGKLTIESILAQDSVFDALVSIYLKNELIGEEVPDFSKTEAIKRFRTLLENSSIVGELKETILVEVERLNKTNAVYFEIFKAIAPCIEGILRNIINKENLTIGNKTGISNYVELIKKAPRTLLKESTLETVDAIFRSHRNLAEHGYIIQPEYARMLCQLAFLLIEDIHRDYLG